jgi:hypothetical protein
MRRLAILLLLLGAMQYVLPLRADAAGTRALMTFGFLILAAVTVGELAKAVRIPKIVGYLGAGLVFGPYVLGVFDSQAAADLAPISGLAIALIAFLAGAELQWAETRKRGKVIIAMLGGELLFSLLAITPRCSRCAHSCRRSARGGPRRSRSRCWWRPSSWCTRRR